MKFDINLLSWNNSEEKQNFYINLIKCYENFDYSLLIQPTNRKDCWENCAKILCYLNDELLWKYIYELLIWTKDVNWPGSMIILNRLKDFSEILLKIPLESAVNEAIILKDDEWLNNLSALIENKNFKNILDETILKILEIHYNDFWK